MFALPKKFSVFLNGMIVVSMLLISMGKNSHAHAAQLASENISLTQDSRTFQAGEAPHVLKVTPEGGFLSGRTTTIQVRFSQPMDPARTESSFSIQPGIAHEFRWIDPATLEIQFSELFAPGSRYILTLSSDQAVNPDGRSLEEDYRWYYLLDPFKIQVDAEQASQVVLSFSAPINQQKSGMPFKIHPDVAGTWNWINNKTATFNAATPFSSAEQYTIQITSPLHDNFGEIPLNSPDLTFTGPPPIRLMDPTAGATIFRDFGPVKIVFSEPMDQASAQAAFRIEPSLEGRFSWSQSASSSFEDTLSFSPNKLFSPGQTYTVSLSTSLKDLSGRPVMLNPFTWSFTTDTYYSFYSAPASFGEYGYNLQVVDVNGRRSLQLAGKDTLEFEAYRYDLIDFVKLYAGHFGGGYGLPEIPLPDPEEERLVTKWYSTGQGGPEIRETVVPPEVPSGLYVLNLKHEGRSFSQLFMVLTRNSVVAKLSGDQLFVWVTDINGAAIPEAEIRLYSARGEKIREGKTDEQGIYRVSVPDEYVPMLVSARVESKEYTDVTLTGLTYGWNSDWFSYSPWGDDVAVPSRYLVYTYTERPIYKPGQNVYFKSIARLDRDVKYSLLPANTMATVNIRDPKDNLLQSKQIPLSEFGTLHDSFTVAEGAMLGTYQIEVVLNGQSHWQAFKVEEYRKPDFQISLTPSSKDDNRLVAGESLNLNVDVRYFFGEPVSKANLTYTHYELHPLNTWWNTNAEDVEYIWYPGSDTAIRGNGTTKADGSAKLALQAQKYPNEYDYGYLGDWHSSLRTKTYAVEVTANDGSNQTVSGYYIYTVSNASEKIRLDTGGYFKRPNTPFTIHADVHDLIDLPVAGRNLTLEIQKWDQKAFEFGGIEGKLELRTDEAGKASHELNLKSGYYKLTLRGTDALGNSMAYERWLGVFANKDDWYDRIYNEIAISADKEFYTPYQNARFMIESSFSGPALLTFERGSVIHTKQVNLTAPLTLVEEEIIPEDAPNVFVTINAWKPTPPTGTLDNEYGYTSNIPDSRLQVDRIEIQVEADTKALDVTIRTDKPIYAPGDPVTVNFEVRDHDLKPVQAELSLALVDEAIFSLSTELSPAIFNAFYGRRPLSVETFDSMRPYRDIVVGGRGGGGGEGGAYAGPRSDFPDTAAWYPALHTDSNGQAFLTFTLPDNVTSWRLSAKAITLRHQVGEARLNIETRKDLLLRPFLPRVLTTGDQAELSVMVHNYTDMQRTIQVSLEADELQLKDATTQSVTIPAGGATVVGWSAIPYGRNESKITFLAAAAGGASDAIELSLPVQPLAITDIQSQSGNFKGSATLDFLKPQEVFAGRSQVILRLSRTPASSLLDGLEFLTGFPYGCVEQTMSRAMPNAVLGRASSHLGIGGNEFRMQIDPLIAASIQKLYAFQHVDGGWGWWFDDNSDPYQTAWVLHGLAVIQAAGYSIDPGVIEDSVRYLNRILNEMDPRTQAYALYSMAMAAEGNLEATQSLATSSAQALDPFSQAALALALHQMGDSTGAKAVQDLLETSVINKGSLAYWPQSGEDGEYHRKTMSSTIRTTAMALSALLAIEGRENPLVQPAADYLIGKRNGYGWGTTNETSFTILALTDYLSAYQTEEGASEVTIKLNGAILSTSTLEPGRMFMNVEIPFSQLQAVENHIQLEGSGDATLYYDLITHYSLSMSRVEKSGMIDVVRQYLDPKTKKPLESIIEGQLVRVQLTLRMPQAGSFMLVEDHLPGGLEALNEGLNTSSRVAEYYDEYYDPTQYFWQDLGYNNKEIHAERVTFFITEVNSGIISLSYLARATTPGTFTALPADVSAMYDPLFWGRSSDAVVVVEEHS